MTADDLHRAILTAHTQLDIPTLITLYAQAADQSADLDAECFFLTYAYIYALERGDARAGDLERRLIAHKRL